MDEIGFRGWLSNGTMSKKTQSDCISRLRRLERELGIDLEQRYSDTQLEDILCIFSNRGINDEMNKYGDVNLPIGKKYLSTYKSALCEYINFASKNNM